MDIYLVGGAVRDGLLGLAQADRDWVVVGASVEDMLQQGFLQVGKDFPVFLHPRTREEYALARTERKSGRGHTGFTLQADPGVTLEEDLRRRDLTINAIAQDDQGRLVDPYGGERDLQQRWLRHVSPAFAEDPLRILRVARFAARFADRGFRVAGETMALMCQMVEADELQDLPPERIWQELHRALGEASPDVFIEVLRQCGALQDLMPELDRLFDIAAATHPQLDLGQHTLLALQQACQLSTDSVVRYAVLLHAAGSEGPGQTDEARAQHVEAVDAISQRLRAPREHAAMARLLARYRHQGHAILSAKAAEILQLLESLDAFRRPDQLQHFLLGCEADARGWPGLENSSYPQATRLRSAFEAARQLDAGALLRQHGLLDSTDDQRESAAKSPKDKALQIRELLTRHRLQAIDRALLTENEPSQPPDGLS